MEEERWTETADKETSEDYLETLGIDKVFRGDLGAHRGRTEEKINEVIFQLNKGS